MKEMILKEEALDMVSIENIKTLKQADLILEACNSSDSEVLEVYVNNAITRGAVYHKLTIVGEGELGLLRDEVATRYNIGGGTVSRYVSIFDNKNILLSKIKGIGPCMDADLKPTLASLLDTIKKDPDNVTKMITHRITSRGINNEIAKVVEDYMETANEDIRYLFSTKSRVALGRLATAIKEDDETKIVHIIKLDGVSEDKDEVTKKELRETIKSLEREIEELKEENEMLKRRNKFLIDSNKLSDVRSFLSRALKNKSILKRYKPELERAFDLLGVDVSTDEAMLKKAYKEKVSIYHSDKTGDDEMFRRVIEANKLVLDFIKGL